MNNSQYYIRVSTACPVTNVADIDFNIENIKKCIDICIEKNQINSFPELCITSYTCGELFHKDY